MAMMPAEMASQSISKGLLETGGQGELDSSLKKEAWLRFLRLGLFMR